MKSLFMSILILSVCLSVNAQRTVDQLFEKYSDNEGFTTITINGNLLKLCRALDDDDDDDFWPGDVNTIRILVQDDEGAANGNFFKMVEKDLDRKNYEEFMRVNNSDSDLLMLVRSQGNRFTEFLIIAGDDNGEDNVLIQVKGEMTYREAKDFSDRIRENHGTDIVISSR